MSNIEGFDFDKAKEIAEKYSHLFRVRNVPSETAGKEEWDNHFKSIFEANVQLAALYGVQVNHMGASHVLDDQRLSERIKLYYDTHPEDRFVQIPYSETPKLMVAEDKVAREAISRVESKLDKLLDILQEKKV